MRSFLRMKNRQARKLPPEFRSQDVRYPDELVATFLQHYTKPGDVVLDPFAGYGTTLLVAEAMDRVPLGVEYDEARAAYIRSLLRRRRLDPEEVQEIRRLVLDHDGVDYARLRAQAYAQSAKADLDAFPPCEERETLALIADFVVDRDR